MSNTIGAVIIGRNEGERLKKCIQSMLSATDTMVYVDSGSSDDSVAYARANSVLVVELDTSIPFSAGRARNEGFQTLLRATPNLDYVQFVDGDCQLYPDWIATAAEFLDANPHCALVCGQRKEIYPQASVYNTLCDIEWNTPVGEALASGGDFLARANALSEVGGFDPTVIAGEEPEMCFRLREKGWKIWRIDCLMTHHDAQMTHIKQWWNRVKRCGHAFAQGAAMHGDSPERYYRREVKSVMVWGGLVPAVMLLCLLLWLAGGPPWLLLSWLAPGLLWLKTFRWAKNDRQLSMKYAAVYAFYIVLGKVPELVGILTYKRRARKKQNLTIIEYK
ncbi:glycosyltransferase family 2 protein [Halioxenophilus aromaticivorans]|uniref:Glycosyltransferase 2-like domain-containing protein n=1 Tax=Halioxenophilus aromaticivorans TaxID=1306992 RepID=A0AAV3U0I3_9ALTE